MPSPAKPEVTISFGEDRAFLEHPHYLPPDDSAPVGEPFGTAPLSHEAVIELPYALTSDQNGHWLAALAARGDSLTNGMKVWVGVEGGDYISLDLVEGFALHGQVVAEYPAATRIVDQEVRLEIEFDSGDKTLEDEVSLAGALDNALLLFAGAELLSAFDLELLFALQHRARRPLCPLNLRVNGDGRTPTCGEGSGVIVNWDRSDPGGTPKARRKRWPLPSTGPWSSCSPWAVGGSASRRGPRGPGSRSSRRRCRRTRHLEPSRRAT